MNIEFSRAFIKKFKKLKDQNLRIGITKAIKETIQAKNPQEITNLKKMAGHKMAYRIRYKSYRIGVYIMNNKVVFTDFAHRKDIYKLFP